MRNCPTRINAGLTLFLSVAHCVSGASFTNLLIFNGTNGNSPVAGVILSGTTLYGTTKAGGNGDGTVFAVNTDGSGFTNLYEFSGHDGIAPYGPLVLSDGILYGTTSMGGGTNNGTTGGFGTVFAISTNGTGFTNLIAFNATNGYDPIAGLILSSNTLYGTTVLGGSTPIGTIFAIHTDGSGFTNLYNPGTINGQTPGSIHAGLVLSGNVLYGVTQGGGTSLDGVVFALNTDGTGFTNLYSFSPTIPVPPTGSTRTNTDGAQPDQTLVLSSNTLFGTTRSGGLHGQGTVFRINTDGTGFKTLYHLTGTANEFAGLIVSGDTLFGTSSGPGRVFAINTDGTGYTNLVGTGVGGLDLGYPPAGSLVLSGQILYGAQTSGPTFNGSVFAVMLPPPTLAIQLINGSVILNWNDPTASFFLQAAPDVGGVYTNVVGATVPFTNILSGPAAFFRLRSN